MRETTQSENELNKVQTTVVKVDVPAIAYIKFFVALALGYALVKLYPVFLIFGLSMLLATALNPGIIWLTRHRVPRWAALALFAAAMVGIVLFVVVGLIPQVLTQVSDLSEKLGPVKAQILENLPAGDVRSFASKSMGAQKDIFAKLGGYLAVAGSFALSFIYQIGLFLIVAIYLLIDGARAYDWFVTFFKPATQGKIHRTSAELQPIVSAYVTGQLITSGIVAVYVFAVHSVLGVPGALMLAMIAAIFDILPVVGFIASTFCAAIMALTVSPATTLTVVVLYLFYQIMENYLIVPHVYGRKLKLSTLVVLVSFVVAGTLAGIPGALLVLPIAAAFPVIEKIWLKKYLGEKVVEGHQNAAASAPESNNRNFAPQKDREPFPAL